MSRSIDEMKAVVGINNELRIDYTIKVPVNSEISISNKYGDIYIDEHNGNMSIEISHGNMRANSLKKVKYLRSNFGNIYISEVQNLQGNLLFSELDLGKADQVMLTSKSTTYEIGEVGELRITTNNDNIDIDEVQYLKLYGNLSKASVYKLTKSADIDLKYGRLKVKKVQNTVCSFYAKSNRSTFDLGFGQTASFKVDGMSSDTDFSSGNSLSHITATEYDVSGYFGNDKSPECVYTFHCQKSKIFFR